MSVEHYCVTCRAKHPAVNVRRERLINGRMIERGNCGACGTKTSLFVKEKA